MRFSDIYAQNAAVKVLKSSIARGQVAHAYLFGGPKNSGKTSAALAFASAINCMQPKADGDSCGACLSCIRIDQENHPDVFVIRPDGNQTRIDQMHEMIKNLNYAPLSGKYKVMIIEQADTLNASSENSILKILEEPPDYAILVLISSNPNSLLPTIRSRCRMVKFRNASTKEIEDYLNANTQLGEDDKRIIAACSQGLVGRAVTIVSRPDFAEERNRALQLLKKWVSAPDVYSIALAEGVREIANPKKGDIDIRSRIQRLNDILDYILSWYADLLALNVQGPEAPIANQDFVEDLRYHSSIYSNDRICTAIREIMNAQRYLEGNITPQLVLESLFFDIRPDKV